MPSISHALVTGASSGIGAAIAREYARRGIPLVLTARRIDRLEALAAQLRAQVPCEVVAADLADPEAPRVLSETLTQRGLTLGRLVNNAGYGVAGNYLSSSWDAHARFLQVMVVATSELTWRFLPQIRASGQGRILNVASFAGLAPGANGQTLYAGAKSFMIKFSESLALENARFGVNVCAVCPGFTHSEFHDVTGTRERVSKLPDWMWLQADQVARVGVDAVEAGRVVAIPGLGYKLAHLANKLLPDTWLRRSMARGSDKFRDPR